MFSASCLRQAAASGQSTYSSSSAAPQPQTPACPAALLMHVTLLRYHYSLCVFIYLYAYSVPHYASQWSISCSSLHHTSSRFCLSLAVKLEFKFSATASFMTVLLFACVQSLVTTAAQRPRRKQNGSLVSRADLLDPSVTPCWTHCQHVGCLLVTTAPELWKKKKQLSCQ